MATESDIVITGVGVISPLGVGREAFWQSLRELRGGIGLISSFDASGLPIRLVGEVHDFDPLKYIKPRKSLKVMARDAQFAIAAAGMAREDAGLAAESVDPDRFGVVLGADTINPAAEEVSPAYRECLIQGHFEFDRWGSDGMFKNYPLGMLKLLPNMLACHISIAQDARGPNNTLYNGDASSLLAISEAASVIARGKADVMLTGGASSRMQPLDWVNSLLRLELSRRNEDPSHALRPFDVQRDGQVRGEGGAVMLLESRRHAQARGAKILARVAGWGSGCDPRSNGLVHAGAGLRRAIENALKMAGMAPQALGHINAHGASTVNGDRIEAQVLHELLPDVPVTAPKSYFGNLFAAGGAVEAVASILALEQGEVPPTLNYEFPDPACPVKVVQREPLRGAAPFALLLNQTVLGQAAALVLAPAE